MLVTNNTSSDIYFGPLHLPGSGTLTVDDTSDTSLYLTNDSVADALNNAYNSGQISVSGEAQPFPRPTGTPEILHGDGDPEGLVFAPQGSVLMRRDGVVTNGGGLYIKTTGVTKSTGWIDMPTASGANAVLPTGAIAAYGGVSAPSGWLICNGSAVSRTVYSLLFTAIGTTYGVGDGSTTFNLPDLQGRVAVGYASGGKSNVNALGNNDGLAANLRNVSHIHHPGSEQASGSGAGWVPYLTASNQYGGAAMSGDSDNPNSPAYLVVNYIIKT